MKFCPECKKDLEDDQFYNCTNGKNGLSWMCRSCRKVYDSSYRKRSKTIQLRRQNRERNRDRINGQMDAYRKKCITDWLAYLNSKNPNGFKCGVCGKDLKLNTNGNPTQKEVVHFDHRNGSGAKIKNPNTFLRSRKCTPEHISLWEECAFGILCQRCNGILPTDNRKAWLQRVTQYVNGV